MKHFTNLRIWLIAAVLMLCVGSVMVQAKTYSLITSDTELEVGAKYLIVGKKTSDFYALGSQNTNNRASVAVTEISGSISVEPASGETDTKPFEITLGGSSGAWTLYDAVNSGYLYAAGSGSNNYLRNQSTSSTWTIAIASNVATMISAARADRNILRFNLTNNPPLFSCYGSGQTDVYLYKEVAQDCTPATVSFAQASVEKSVLDAAFTNTFTSNNTSATVYASSDTDVATVNTSNGLITIKGAGTTTIYASQEADGTCCAVNASYILTVNPLPAPIAADATEVEANSFTANWSAVADATSYELLVYQKEIIEGIAQLATNPGFEAWTDGKPDGWLGSKSSIAAKDVVKYETSSQDGDYAVQLINSGTSHKRFTTSAIQVTAEQEYAVTFWVRGKGDIRLGLFDGREAGSGYSAYTNYINVETSDWEEHTLNVEATETTASGEFIFSVVKTDEANDHLQLDNVTIAELNKTLVNEITGSPFTVTTNSKVVDGLEPKTEYFYKVKAIVAAHESVFSNEISVETTVGAGVQSPFETHKVWVQDGKLMVNADAVELVKVFDITGKKVEERTVATGLNQITLRAHGVYIVQLGDSIQKVIL